MVYGRILKLGAKMTITTNKWLDMGKQTFIHSDANKKSI